MPRKYIPFLFFVITILLSFLSIFYLQQRYTALLQGGQEYQWPVQLEQKQTLVPSDYLNIDFIGARTTWVGKTVPEVDSIVYVNLGVQPNGIIYIKNAAPIKPSKGLYIMARVKKFNNGIIEFSVPFNRYRIDTHKVNPVFYSGNYKGILIATFKIRDGRGVITGVYCKGVPLERAKPQSEEELKENAPFLLQNGSLVDTAKELKKNRQDTQKKDDKL